MPQWGAVNWSAWRDIVISYLAEGAGGLQWLAGYLGLTLVFVWFSCGMSHSGKSLISVFQEFSASIGKAFILVGGWALGYHSTEFRHFPEIS